MTAETTDSVTQWLHPVTGERATLTTRGPQTVLVRQFSSDSATTPVVDHPASAGQALKQEGFCRMTARQADGALWLPPSLHPLRAALEASQRPLLRLAADPARTPAPWDSRVGGVSYRPLGAPWPMSHGDTEGGSRPLVFLAQFNLAELGAQAAWPDLPAQGLLQVFILNAEFYGADFNGHWDDPDGFRVLYWPEVVEDAGALDPQMVTPLPDDLNDDPWDGLPLWGMGVGPLGRAVALSAIVDREPVSGSDQTTPTPQDVDLEQVGVSSDAHADLYDLVPGGHKLGGYPNFTQSDPRGPGDGWVLLLQLDSDEALGLMWGDGGTANFFIRPADLRARDFSKVAYNWDCG